MTHERRNLVRRDSVSLAHILDIAVQNRQRNSGRRITVLVILDVAVFVRQKNRLLEIVKKELHLLVTSFHSHPVNVCCWHQKPPFNFSNDMASRIFWSKSLISLISSEYEETCWGASTGFTISFFFIQCPVSFACLLRSLIIYRELNLHERLSRIVLGIVCSRIHRVCSICHISIFVMTLHILRS